LNMAVVVAGGLFFALIVVYGILESFFGWEK
jgi:hypothetical protein